MTTLTTLTATASGKGKFGQYLLHSLAIAHANKLKAGVNITGFDFGCIIDVRLFSRP